MEARLQRRVQRYGWDRVAAHYEAHWMHQLRPCHERMLALAALRPGESVIELACGTGLVTFAAAAAVGPIGRVRATDISGEMIAAARELATARGIANIEFDRMDAQQVATTAARFDVGLCALGLMYFPDPEDALAQLCRVLCPGGRVAVSVRGRRDRCGWADLFPIIDSRVETEVCPLFFRLGTEGALARAFEAARFTGFRAERIDTELRYSDDQDACAAAFLGGQVALAYGRFDATTRAAVYSEYLASIARFRHGLGYAVPGEFVIATGRVPN